jgi:replication-associated recombination protein RarA
MAFMSYDPWRGITSRNGLPGDELVAALQKAIRRADVDVAIDVAYEMYITSEQFEDKLWRRLTIISCEDIGFGNINAITVINNLDEARKKFPYADGDRPFFFIHAIRFLCKQPKERTTDHIKNLVIKKFEQGYVPKIPDYAYDVHTVKGRAKGRDIIHFLDEASKVTPLMEGYDDSYRQQLKKVVKEEQEKGLKPKEGSFVYNMWQA